jgi:hypothetical protein
MPIPLNRPNAIARGAAVLLAGTFAAGCATPNIKVGVQTRSQLHVELDEPREILVSVPPRCAILPSAVSGASAGLGPFNDQSIGRMIEDAVERRGERGPLGWLAGDGDGDGDVSEETVFSPADVVNAANTAGLGGELKSLIGSVTAAGVLDRDRLRRIGRLLDVEYVMLPWLAGVHTDNATRFNFAGITLVRTGWTTVEMVLQLWHAPSGRLVWQSTASGTLVGEGVVGTPPSIQPVLDALLRAMLEDFVSGRSESVLSTEIAPTPAPSAPASASSGAEATAEKGVAAGEAASPPSEPARTKPAPPAAGAP